MPNRACVCVYWLVQHLGVKCAIKGYVVIMMVAMVTRSMAYFLIVIPVCH